MQARPPGGGRGRLNPQRARKCIDNPRTVRLKSRMAPLLPPGFAIRRAEGTDIPALERLVEISVRGLHPQCYSEEQTRLSLGKIFALDRQLVEDGTYYVIESQGRIVACGEIGRASCRERV